MIYNCTIPEKIKVSTVYKETKESKEKRIN